MTTELEQNIAKIQAELELLKAHERKVWEQERNAKLLSLAKSMTFTVHEQCHDVFVTDEVVEIRLSPHSEEYHEELSRMGSMGYIISRKHRKIIGSCGGGYVLIPMPDKPNSFYNTRTATTENDYMHWVHKAADKALADYLTKL